MNERWQRRFGIRAFEEFIIRLLASQARNAHWSDRDLPVPLLHTVSREEMLERFLAGRPDLRPFRLELAEVYAVVSEFCVNKGLWDQLVAA